MASEIRVDKINSLSGVGTVTLSPTGVDISGITTVQTLKVGTGLTASEDGDIFFTGVCTATTFSGAHSGSGANLTSLPAGNLTGALPAISGANLTGIAATDNVRTGILDVAGVSTFRNTMNVGAAVTISESGIEASGIGITCANLNGGQIGGRRNLIINGDMNVAQRGTSSSSFDFATVDRFRFVKRATVDNLVITQSQSTDSPDGFATSYKADVTTAESALAADEHFYMSYKTEAQDLQYIKGKQLTLSFHVKAYQTGTYSVSIYQQDGNRLVSGTYTINSSATWEKKTITFPVNSGTQPDNNNAQGFEISWILAAGSDFTSSNSTSWTSYSDAGYAYGQGVNVMSSTDNYWQITGVQLEVGNQATEYEHKTHHEELSACQRYFYKIVGTDSDMAAFGFNYSSSAHYFNIEFPVPMRDYPTYTGSATAARIFAQNIGQDFNLSSLAIVGNMTNAYPKRVTLYVSQGGATAGEGGLLSIQNEEGYLQFSSEL